MLCPSCHQEASSVLRTLFSLQGVSQSEAMQGYLRCQGCDALLRFAWFDTHLRLVKLAVVVMTLVFCFLFLNPLLVSIGPTATVMCWLGLICLLALLYEFGMWKYALVERVHEVLDLVKKSSS